MHQQREHNAETVTSYQKEGKMSESCKNNRRHTVSIPYSDPNHDNRSERKKQLMNGTRKDESFLLGHLSREELIQRVVELEKEKEISKLSGKQIINSPSSPFFY
jgi:hypothetical protein